MELNFASVKNVRPDLGGGVHVGNPSACGAEARELGVQRHLGLHDTLSPKHKTKQNLFNWIWWQMPVMSTLGRLRHENGEFKVSLVGTIALSGAPAERLGKR